jgi:hypothetical protein
MGTPQICWACGLANAVLETDGDFGLFIGRRAPWLASVLFGYFQALNKKVSIYFRIRPI